MILSGRRILIIISSILTVLVAPRLVFAETIVTGDSHSSVSVKNSGGTGRTDIVIECNGVKKEYHSDKAENVTLNCDDEASGTVKSEVRINNNGSSTTPNPTVEAGKEKIKDGIEKKKSEIKAEVKSAKDTLEKERKDLFEEFTQMIRDLFKDFHF